MSCIKAERRGRFLIQEIEDMISYQKNESQDTPIKHNLKLKTKRHNSNAESKMLYVCKKKDPTYSSDYNCDVYDTRLQKYISCDDIWKQIASRCNIVENDLCLFKYFYSESEEDQNIHLYAKDSSGTSYYEESTIELSFFGSRQISEETLGKETEIGSFSMTNKKEIGKAYSIQNVSTFNFLPDKYNRKCTN